MLKVQTIAGIVITLLTFSFSLGGRASPIVPPHHQAASAVLTMKRQSGGLRFVQALCPVNTNPYVESLDPGGSADAIETFVNSSGCAGQVTVSSDVPVQVTMYDSTGVLRAQDQGTTVVMNISSAGTFDFRVTNISQTPAVIRVQDS